jgi:hypothetical protein
MIRIVLEMEPGDLRDPISSFISLIPKAKATAPAVERPLPLPVKPAKPTSKAKVKSAPDPNSTRARIVEMLRRKPMTSAQLVKSLDTIKAASSVNATLQAMRASGAVLVRQDVGVHGKTNYLPDCPEGIVTGAQAIAH